MAGSVREKGRCAGVNFENPAPMPARPLKKASENIFIAV